MTTALFPSSRTSALCLILVASLTISACGDSAVGADEAVLDQSTSLEIFSELSSQIMMVAFSGLKTDDGLDLPSATAEEVPVSVSAVCEAGGKMTVTGTVSTNISDDSGSYGYDLRQKPEKCGIVTSQGTFMVDGDPHLRVRANVDFEAGEPVGVFEFGWEGGFKWDGTGGSGSCTVDLAYAFNWQSAAYSIRGSMCGHNMDVNVNS